jgi:excinuclease ABC subunit C
MKKQKTKSLTPLIHHIKQLPAKPGVYLFADDDHILYIGKAKNLKNRIKSYLQQQKTNWKAASLLTESTKLNHHVTCNELEAMLLEAKLIQTHQPKFNVLLKTGQPFLYIMVSKGKLPELQLVRNKKKKGIYFGPFIEKGPVRKVHSFLIKTFKLKICNKKIENGCLYYHLRQCAGSCRNDFDYNGYLKRLDLAIKSLQKGHKKFLRYLQEQIEIHNKNLDFEQSKELAEYKTAFEQIFSSLNTLFSESGKTRLLVQKDIWILSENKQTLYLFKEQNGALTKKHTFYALLNKWHADQTDWYCDYFVSYYRTYPAPSIILINFELEDKKLIEQFLHKWSNIPFESKIIQPTEGHFFNLIRLGQIHASKLQIRQMTTPRALKQLLKLPQAPHTIDCFDISHKQGMFMVGSAVRFTDGQPDKNSFRRFHIKTVDKQDDYAALQEIVKRRYKNKKDLPDLILIDGGKGQLNAINNLFNVEYASLAKKEETIFSKRLPEGKKLNIETFSGQLLVALRDYTHHFAISFHRKVATQLKK